jgi:hypothetical protein
MGRKLLHKQLRFTKDVIRTLIESMLSLSIQHEQIYLFDLTQFKDLSLLMQLKLRKRTITTTPHWSIIPHNNWSIWLFTQTCQCVFTQLCQCHLELERVKRLSSFYLGHFFSSKSFDHITKDVSILHFKLGNSHRFSYFSTSTPSKHTSHHHGWSIASCQFLTYKYDYHKRSIMDMEIFSHLLLTNLMSYHFSFSS